jgi:hypothetical protein
MEEKEWKPFRKCLDKSDRKVFDKMFSIAHLYNSACSYAANPIRINPTFMSIIFHHYKQLTMITNQTNSSSKSVIAANDNSHSLIEDLTLFSPNKDDILLLIKEIKSWSGFANSLRTAKDRKLFKRMLNGCYKYVTAINTKDEPFSTESLLVALIFEQQKMIDWLIVHISPSFSSPPCLRPAMKQRRQ